MTDDEQAFLAQVALGIFKVDPSGKIWRIARWSGGGTPSLIYIPKQRAERSSDGRGGYLRVMFKAGAGRRKVGAHRIVWMISNRRPIPKGMEINHIDGDKRNNAPSNLELVTHQQNAQHCHTHLSPKKKDQRGEKNSSAVVTEAQVGQIREMWRVRAMSQREIAAMFGITQSTVSAIVLRKNWSHVQ